MNTILFTLILLSFGRLEVVEGIGEKLLAGADVLALSGSNLSDYESFNATLINSSLIPQKTGLRFNIGSGLVNNDEKRSVLAYDPFDNTVGEAIIYSRSNNFTYPLSFGVSYSNGFVGISLSRLPSYDISYKYSKIERLDAYTIKAKEEEEYSGSIVKNRLGVGLKLKKSISLGLALDYLKGKKEYFHYIYDPPEETVEGDTVQFSGISYGLSATFAINYRASISFILNSNTKLKGDMDWRLPKSIAISFMMRPPSRVETKVYFTYERVFYKSERADLEDVNDFRIGFEHYILPRNSVMIGARLRNSSCREKLYIPSFSLGTKAILNAFTVTLGLLYEPVEYDLYVSGVKNKVRESKTKVFIGFESKI